MTLLFHLPVNRTAGTLTFFGLTKKKSPRCHLRHGMFSRPIPLFRIHFMYWIRAVGTNKPKEDSFEREKIFCSLPRHTFLSQIGNEARPAKNSEIILKSSFYPKTTTCIILPFLSAVLLLQYFWILSFSVFSPFFPFVACICPIRCHCVGGEFFRRREKQGTGGI